MAKFQHITGDRKYSVQIATIDAQHQKLFSILNKAVDLYNSGPSELYPILKDLIGYLSKHFHAEHRPGVIYI